ncbi:MAG: hypothetical protein FVQ79_04975 [Planctomycetes bacterium]|nr:hypothetical protein [Planctomycetota bacterium]
MTTTAFNAFLDSNTKQFNYDAVGRLEQVVLPVVDDPNDDPDDGETVNPVYDYFYDDYGNQIGILDSLGRLTVFKYDYMGRQIEKFMPFAVAPVDQSDLLDGTVNVYDVLATSDPNSQQQFYDDSNGGRVFKSRDYKGQVTYYYYYGFDYVTQDGGGTFYGKPGQLCYKNSYFTDPQTDDISKPDPETETPDSQTSYIYDEYGRQETVDFDDDTTYYYYDSQGRTNKIVSQQGTVNYDYDAITGRKIATWTGTNSAVPVTKTEYTYDEMGRGN